MIILMKNKVNTIQKNNIIVFPNIKFIRFNNVTFLCVNKAGTIILRFIISAHVHYNVYIGTEGRVNMLLITLLH